MRDLTSCTSVVSLTSMTLDVACGWQRLMKAPGPRGGKKKKTHTWVAPQVESLLICVSLKVSAEIPSGSETDAFLVSLPLSSRYVTLFFDFFRKTFWFIFHGAKWREQKQTEVEMKYTEIDGGQRHACTYMPCGGNMTQTSLSWTIPPKNGNKIKRMQPVIAAKSGYSGLTVVEEVLR